jgi:anti-sigma factor RsiW
LNGKAYTCREVEGLFEAFLDGALESREEEAMRAHVAACPACGARYALDLALVQTIRTAPEEALESVAGEVVGRIKVRRRRRLALRWGAAAAFVFWGALLVVRFGSDIYELGLSLVTGSYRTSSAYLALSKVAGLAMNFATGIKNVILSGRAPAGLEFYAPEAAVVALMTGTFVILMMYGIGRWLAKPMEVNS